MPHKSKLKGAHGWLIVIGAVAAIDALAQEDQTLSDALHAGRRRYPVTVTTAVLATAYHLLCGDHPTLGRFDAFRLRHPLIRLFHTLTTPEAPNQDSRATWVAAMTHPRPRRRSRKQAS